MFVLMNTILFLPTAYINDSQRNTILFLPTAYINEEKSNIHINFLNQYGKEAQSPCGPSLLS